jgi:CRP-like cAMP-binding protein
MYQESAELRAELDRIATIVSLPAGTSLFRCGQPVSGVFIVHKGSVRMTLDSSDDLLPPRLFGPGEILGLPATLTGHYSLSAAVHEDAELAFIPAPRVQELLECSPALCLVATRMMSGEIARMRSALRDGVQPHLRT